MRILLLGGWGMPASVLAPLRMALGVAQEHCHVLDKPWPIMREQLLEDIQPGTLLIGWSLGGSLALDLASEAKTNLSAMVTIATNPLFVASSDWPHAYSIDLFSAFAQMLRDDPAATMARFAALATAGSTFQRDELRWLKSHLEPEALFRREVLEESLSMLGHVDARAAWRQLEIPVLGIFGQQDALVPAAVMQDLARLKPTHSLHLIPGMSHLPSYRYAEEVAEAIRDRILPMIRSWC